MANNKFRKISILSIVSFLAIFILQAFWIYDSYQERQAHFTQHIFHILNQSADDLSQLEEYSNCKMEEGIEKTKFDSILKSRLKQIDETPQYSFQILHSDETCKYQLGKNEKVFKQALRSSYGNERNIFLFIKYEGSYFLHSLLTWIILSSALIIIGITAVFINLSFIRKQKKVSSIQSDFIGNMTHELKTPIATISVASEMLMKDKVLDDREKSKRYSRIIFEENIRLRKLVERVMQIALFENGTMRIRLQEIDLHESINKSIEAISMIVHNRNGEISGDLSASKALFQVDPTHFSNIITNLLENGIKYSKEKPIIQVTTSDYSDGILISISDKGIGIPKKFQERVFDRFFRVETGDVHNTSGFGLGLYYVRRVVEAHGGTIKIISGEAEGSQFDVYIPTI